MIVRSLITLLGFKVDDKGAKKFEQTIGALKQGAMIAGAAILGVGTYMVKAASDVEKYKTQLKVMLGSQELANARFKEMADFAASTPFELNDIVQLGNQLQALGRYSKENMTLLGDLASAAGKPIEQVTGAFAKLASGQKGIAIDMFRDLLISTKDWQEATGAAISKSGELQATTEQMMAALPKILAKKGFSGMMAEQAKTFEGVMSNAKDSVTQLAAEVGSQLLPTMKDLLTTTTQVLQANQQFIASGLTKFFASIQSILQSVAGLIQNFFNGLGGFSVLTNFLQSMVDLVASVVDDLAKTLGPIFEGLGGILGPILRIVQMLAQKLGELVGRVLRPFSSIMKSIGNIFKWVGKVVESFMPVISLVVDIFGTKLRMAIEAMLIPFKFVLAVLEPILTGLAEMATIIMNALAPGLGSAGKGMGDFNSLLDAVYPLVDALIGILKGLVTLIMGALVGAIKFLSPVLSGIGSVFGFVIEQVSSLVGWIKDLVGWVAEAVSGFMKLLGLEKQSVTVAKGSITTAEAEAAGMPVGKAKMGFAGPKVGYAQGTPFVPENQWAFLHKGEAVIPAEYAKGGSSGGISVNANINISVPAGTPQTQAAFVKEAAKQAVRVELSAILSQTMNSNTRAAY